MNLTLKVWRQENADDPGHFATYIAQDIASDMSFLEMLDVVNENIIADDGEPIAFDSDCREGICGACSMASMVCRMGGSRAPLLVSYTCGTSALGTPLPSSHGGRRPFQCIGI